MKSTYKEIVSSGFEYDVRFCPKCRDMELYRNIDNKWKCEKCRKKINKNKGRESDANSNRTKK